MRRPPVAVSERYTAIEGNDDMGTEKLLDDLERVIKDVATLVDSGEVEFSDVSDAFMDALWHKSTGNVRNDLAVLIRKLKGPPPTPVRGDPSRAYPPYRREPSVTRWHIGRVESRKNGLETEELVRGKTRQVQLDQLMTLRIIAKLTG